MSGLKLRTRLPSSTPSETLRSSRSLLTYDYVSGRPIGMDVTRTRAGRTFRQDLALEEGQPDHITQKVLSLQTASGMPQVTIPIGSIVRQDYSSLGVGVTVSVSRSGGGAKRQMFN